MLGSVVNCIAVILAGLAGAQIKQRLRESYKHIVMQGIGIAILFVGASGAISNMIKPESNAVLFILSLVLGGLLGTWIGISRRLTQFGNWIQSKLAKDSDGFAAGFVYASILFCVGTMSVIGAMESGIKGDHSILLVKSVIDGVTALILGASMGIGVAGSGLALLVYEGALTILAGLFAPYITADMMREMSIVGGILIACIGLDMLDILKLRVADFLPAVFLPVLYYLATGLLH